MKSGDLSTTITWQTLEKDYGKCIAEPYERGYGHTIGNSLRRILLSSLEGAAVTTAKIKGAPHEFTTLPGVVEDVTGIILNLKQLRFKLFSDGPETLRLSIDKEGKVLAKHFEANSNVEILTPDALIATLDSGGEIEMEVEICKGRGYVPAELNKRPDHPVGTIWIDSIFTPVRKVHYDVQNARVGQRTDYDKLVMEIWTDGSIKPDDALAYSAKILKDAMGLYINFSEETAPVAASAAPAEDGRLEDDRLKELLAQTVDIIELSVRSANCLKVAKLRTIGELVKKKPQELLNYKNFGKKSLDEIQEKLSELGLSLAAEE